jgi:hypothetical protein
MYRKYHVAAWMALLAVVLAASACVPANLQPATPAPTAPLATTAAALATPVEPTLAIPTVALTATAALTPTTAAPAATSALTVTTPTVTATVAATATVPVTATAGVAVTGTATAVVTGTAEVTGTTYTDPWAYCAAVGTVDTPGPRYTGPAMPEALAQGLQFAVTNKPGTPTPPILNGSFWRCMDGKVYACTVGANLPCQSKANTSRTPNDGMTQYCKEQPSSDFIPAYITGHETVYEWRCENGQPAVVKQVTQTDAQGYQTNIWYEIPPVK